MRGQPGFTRTHSGLIRRRVGYANNTRSSGFTIIEVILFLAVSGMLFIIGLTYMSGTVRSVRFQDATRTVESFIQRQYSAVQTNSVARTDWAASATPGNRLQATCSASTQIVVAPGGPTGSASGQGNSGSCVLLGAELVFGTFGLSATKVDVYPILGYANGATGLSTVDSLQNANPRVLAAITTATSGPTESFTLPWGTNFAKMRSESTPTATAVGNGYNAIAILRSPQSESINLVYHNIGAAGTIGSFDLRPAISTAGQRNIKAALCLQSPGDDRRGAIILNGTAGSENFSISSISSGLRTTTDVLLPGTGLTCA